MSRNQKNIICSGTFQDTVIGLQALSEYSLKTYNKDLDLRVTLLADEWDNVQQFSVTSENSIAQKVIKKVRKINIIELLYFCVSLYEIAVEWKSTGTDIQLN